MSDQLMQYYISKGFTKEYVQHIRDTQDKMKYVGEPHDNDNPSVGEGVVRNGKVMIWEGPIIGFVGFLEHGLLVKAQKTKSSNEPFFKRPYT